MCVFGTLKMGDVAVFFIFLLVFTSILFITRYIHTAKPSSARVYNSRLVFVFSYFFDKNLRTNFCVAGIFYFRTVGVGRRSLFLFSAERRFCVK